MEGTSERISQETGVIPVKTVVEIPGKTPTRMLGETPERFSSSSGEV